MTATTIQITTEQRLTIVKHLASGKDLDTTATLVRMDRSTVLDIASHHGFPSTELLTRAVALLEKKIEREQEPAPHPDAAAISREQHAQSRPAAVASTPAAAGLTRPDEIRVLINTAKGHPSKRIQAAGDRVIDAVDRLKDLIREDEEKHAEKRRQETERIAARAEVERLSKALADAKAKLRGSKPTASPATPDSGASASDIRAWARSSGVECPSVGRVPSTVRAAYDDAHREAS